MTPAGRASRRVMFPATWADVGEPDFSGAVTLERRFGYPGRIESHERVWLIGDGAAGPIDVALQGEALGTVANGRFAFEVTARLGERNRLTLTLDAGPDRVRLWDDIALEIRATAYLDDVVREAGRVTGRIAGTCDGPLDIYVLADGGESGYCQGSAGDVFAIPIENPSRVELIHVSTVWDVVELTKPNAPEPPRRP